MQEAIQDDRAFKAFMIDLTLTQSQRFGNVLNLLDKIEDFFGGVGSDEYTEDEARAIWHDMLTELHQARNTLIEKGHSFNGFMGVLETIFDLHLARQRLSEMDEASEVFPAEEFTATTVQLVRSLIEIARFYSEYYVKIADRAETNYQKSREGD